MFVGFLHFYSWKCLNTTGFSYQYWVLQTRVLRLWSGLKGGQRQVILLWGPEDQDNEAPCRQRGTALCFQDRALMGDSNPTSIIWRDPRAGHRQSRRFLECIDNNFPRLLRIQGGKAVLDLVLNNKEEIVGNVKTKGSLGCFDNSAVKFEICEGTKKAHNPELQESRLQWCLW